MAQTLRCNKCGTENILGAHFCTTCGEKFLYSCPQCNTNIEPGDEHCPHCATSLNWGTMPEQTMETSPGQVEIANTKSREIKKNKSTESKLPSRKGINPWLIALIITIVLIIAIFIIDKVINF